MENFRDRLGTPDPQPDASPDARGDGRTDRAADGPDERAMRFADGGRVRMADLEISPDAKPPAGADQRREAYVKEYARQLAPADTGEALLADESGGLGEPVERGPLADKIQAAVDKGRVAADRLRGGDAPDEAALRVDRPWSNDPYTDGWPPNGYRPGALDDAEGNRTPLFNGKPKREDTEQGQIGDCGVIATLGALAGHKPDTIADAIKQNSDGTYAVRLYRATSAYGDGLTQADRPDMSKPGRPYTFTVTPDLPAREDTGKLISAKSKEVAWPAVMEKAIAGSDQAWTPEQKQAHEALWDVRKDITDRKRIAAGEAPLPDGPAPTGYVRLNQGTTPWDRAELMTALTGRQSEVRTIPDDDNELIKGIFADKLSYDKPVLVGSRPRDKAGGERPFPHALEASHVYEVTGLTSDGRVQLRNPWNSDHPDPLTLDQFREYFRQKNADGSRVGRYTTLT